MEQEDTEIKTTLIVFDGANKRVYYFSDSIEKVSKLLERIMSDKESYMTGGIIHKSDRIVSFISYEYLKDKGFQLYEGHYQ